MGCRRCDGLGRNMDGRHSGQSGGHGCDGGTHSEGHRGRRKCTVVGGTIEGVGHAKAFPSLINSIRRVGSVTLPAERLSKRNKGFGSGTMEEGIGDAGGGEDVGTAGDPDEVVPSGTVQRKQIDDHSGHGGQDKAQVFNDNLAIVDAAESGLVLVGQT